IERGGHDAAPGGGSHRWVGKGRQDSRALTLLVLVPIGKRGDYRPEHGEPETEVAAPRGSAPRRTQSGRARKVDDRANSKRVHSTALAKSPEPGGECLTIVISRLARLAAHDVSNHACRLFASPLEPA